MHCQYMDFELAEAKAEKEKILAGQNSEVLSNCVTCYACEEYCPADNHPFYQIVERQEEQGILPVPIPITKRLILQSKEKNPQHT